RTPSVAIKAISARCRPSLLRGSFGDRARVVVMAILFLPPNGGEGRPYGACGRRDRASAPQLRWTSSLGRSGRDSLSTIASSDAATGHHRHRAPPPYSVTSAR